MSDFIDDGYTEQGYIAPEEGIHGELEFTYRPVLVVKRDAINRLFVQDKPEQGVEKAADEMSRSVQEWSAKDSSGKPVARSAANIRRLKPRMFDKLWQIVSGARASDTRPGGQPAVIPDLEADAKN